MMPSLDLNTPSGVKSFIIQEIQRQVARRESSDPWLSPGEAARHASCSKDYILRSIRFGTGPQVVGEGRLLRMRRSAVDAWLAQRGKRRPPDA